MMGKTELGIEGEGHTPAKVVRLHSQGRPSFGAIAHPEDEDTFASFEVDVTGAFVLRIEGPEGRFEQRDAEGPRPRRLARLMMTLAAYRFFSAADHSEAVSVLYGVPISDLETEGMRRAGRVVAYLASSLVDR